MKKLLHSLLKTHSVCAHPSFIQSMCAHVILKIMECEIFFLPNSCPFSTEDTHKGDVHELKMQPLSLSLFLVLLNR